MAWRGKITLALHPLLSSFIQSGKLLHDSPQLIRAMQFIELQGEADQVVNNLTFTHITPLPLKFLCKVTSSDSHG